jgi:hypothetical protein
MTDLRAQLKRIVELGMAACDVDAQAPVETGALKELVVMLPELLAALPAEGDRRVDPCGCEQVTTKLCAWHTYQGHPARQPRPRGDKA